MSDRYVPASRYSGAASMRANLTRAYAKANGRGW
jgi:hypothetical protein